MGDRVAETTNGLTTTHFALDVQGLPEVIYTDKGNTFLHLPGVIMTENAAGEVRYLLSDGLGSVRQAVDDAGAVVAYNEYDPYGNPTLNDSLSTHPYGYTGEWWQDEIDLLYLRARWYMPETGTFLSVDPVEGEPPYQYVRGNPINLADPTGYFPKMCHGKGSKEEYAKCVMDETGLWPATLSMPGIYYIFQDDDITIPPFQTNYEQAFWGEENKLYDNVRGSDNCWEGPVPYIGPGYIEGAGGYVTFLTGGVEKVYDFARMEGRQFVYGGGEIADGFIGGGIMLYTGVAKGFRSNYPIEADYGGWSRAYSVGASVPSPIPEIPLSFGGGYILFNTPSTWQVGGEAFYLGASKSWKDIPVLDVSASLLYYYPSSKTIYYARSGQSEKSPFSKVLRALLVSDIIYGTGSPYNEHPVTRGTETIVRAFAVHTALSWADRYDDMYFGSRLQ